MATRMKAWRDSEEQQRTKKDEDTRVGRVAEAIVGTALIGVAMLRT